MLAFVGDRPIDEVDQRPILRLFIFFKKCCCCSRIELLDTRIAVFSWKGATVELIGPTTSAYVAEQTPMVR